MARATVRIVRPDPAGRRSSILKTLLNGALEVANLPCALLYFGLARLAPARADVTFTGFSQLYSLVPGVTGQFIRRAFYRWTLIECPRDCSIGFGTTFATSHVRIGARTYIGVYCNIGHVTIGEDGLIGSNVCILSGKSQHRFDRLDIPAARQGGQYREVAVGRDVWIGNGAIVMDDVGEQAVVAAGAVVVNAVSPRSIVGGNPARTIGQRGGAAEGVPLPE